MSERTAALLKKAFHEASRADWLWTAPNPRVGALALRQGQIVGRGCHLRWGGPHAEEMALRDAGAWDSAENVPIPGIVDEMVLTLEPCSSQGGSKKRPPCSGLLLGAEVQALTIGAVDPDPRHSGAGLDVMREGGLKNIWIVESGAEMSVANGAFLQHLSQPDRPWTFAKWAASLDGKTASSEGRSRWISQDLARAEVHALRASSDAVLAGPGTIQCDDPGLDARLEMSDGGAQPLRIALTKVIPELDSKLFATKSKLMLVLSEEAAVNVPALPAHVEVLIHPVDSEGRFLLPTLWKVLRQQFGIQRLMVEGGAKLHGALLSAGLLDAVVQYQSPLLMGGPRAAMDNHGFSDPSCAQILIDEERKDLGPDLRRAFRLLPRSG